MSARSVIRVITWNCHMALARKAPSLLALRPDIAVIQECSAEAELTGMVRVGWCGRHSNKGLAVFARPSLNAVVADEWDPTREWFLPVRIDSIGMNLLGVWAMNQRGLEDRPKKGRAGAAIEHYRSFLAGGRTLLAGDLNNNVFWDTTRSPEFEAFTNLLASMGLVNLYYARTGDTPGAETRGSLFFLHNAERSYLIDHVFLPETWLERVVEFEVGLPADWLELSDHAPVIVDLAIPDEYPMKSGGPGHSKRSQSMSLGSSGANPSGSASTDDPLVEFRSWLNERIAQDGRSLNAIEKAAGIHGNGLGKVLRGERGSVASLTPLYIKRLAPVLGISEATLLARAGHLSEVQAPPSAEQVILGDPDLVQEDKELLIGIYRRLKSS